MRVKTLVTVIAVSAAGALAQEQQRAQRETATVSFDGKKVAIEYGRPALRGRTIDALTAQLPPDRIWRAGENQVTTLTTDTDLLVGDKRVPAGKYSVYMHAPAQGNWSLVLNSDPGVPLKQIYAAASPEVADALWPRLDGYETVAGKELARIQLTPANPPAPAERFVIRLEPAKSGASALTLLWGDRGWKTTVKPAKAP